MTMPHCAVSVDYIVATATQSTNQDYYRLESPGSKLAHICIFATQFTCTWNRFGFFKFVGVCKNCKFGSVCQGLRHSIAVRYMPQNRHCAETVVVWRTACLSVCLSVQVTQLPCCPDEPHTSIMYVLKLRKKIGPSLLGRRGRRQPWRTPSIVPQTTNIIIDVHFFYSQ